MENLLGKKQKMKERKRYNLNLCALNNFLGAFSPFFSGKIRDGEHIEGRKEEGRAYMKNFLVEFEAEIMVRYKDIAHYLKLLTTISIIILLVVIVK